MNKSDVLNNVAELTTDILKEQAETEEAKAKIRVSKKMAAAFMDAFETVIRDAVSADITDYVQFGGLGKFIGKDVPARSGKSPMDGKEWHTEAHEEIAFKMSSKGKLL